MLSFLATEIPGLLGRFLFKFILPALCSAILGIFILVWVSRRLRQSGRSRTLPLVGLTLFQLLLIPSLTAFFSFQYAGNSVSAAFLEGGSARISSWVVKKGTALMRSQLPGEVGGGTVSPGKILDIANSRKREIGAKLPTPLSEALEKGGIPKDVASLSSVRLDQVSVVAEYVFWVAVVDIARSAGLPAGDMTWQSLADLAGSKFDEHSNATFAEISGGLRAAASHMLITIIALNVIAGFLIVLVVSRLARPKSLSVNQSR